MTSSVARSWASDGWVAQVVVQHERADAEPFGRHRGGGEHRDRRELRLQVVVDAEMGVADGLGRAGMLDQRRPIDDLAESRHQLERAWHGQTVADAG